MAWRTSPWPRATRKGPEGAEALARKALDIYLPRLPADHWLIAGAETVLGACLSDQGRFSDAERLLLRSHSVLAGLQGTTDRYAVEALKRVITFYHQWGKTAKVSEHCARLAEVPDQKIPFEVCTARSDLSGP